MIHLGNDHWSAFARHGQYLQVRTEPNHSTQNASTHHPDGINIQKQVRNQEEQTFETTKSAGTPKKKSAHMIHATNTAAFHSTTMKKAQQAMRTILKTRLNT